ncbi:MAG TPA: TRAP transporter large permease subunit [Usitatibacter sp.]|jgi:TRAP-type mannitol/chloroaromatic compound transport system permease large subunit|nr:TRAP transporter large permease subunit [Usitatibacter sp.]
METGGLWMLAAVGIGMVATGLPAWIVLIGVSLAFATGGIAAGIFDASFVAAIYPRLIGLLENDLLQALPLYVLMGVIIARTPLAETLFGAARSVLAPTRRAAPLAGLSLGVLLAPMCGSVGAGVAMFSRTLHPHLAAAGLREERSMALVCVVSTLGVVVPPSLVLILLGDAMMRAHTEAAHIAGLNDRIVNTQDVFHAALVPAGIFVALCAVVIAWQARGIREATPVRPTRAQWITAAAATLMLASLLAGVALGYLYAVEAAATGGLLLAIHGFATRTLRREHLGAVLHDTLSLTGALFALLIAANVFTLVERAFGTDRWLAQLFSGLGVNAVLAAGLGAIAVCALVLDAFEMIFVVIPLVAPALLTRVPDAPWVAVLVLLILQASFLVPPFGYAVMMARSRLGTRVPTPALMRAMLPFLAAQLAVLLLALAFPGLLWRESASLAPSTPPADAQTLEQMLDRIQGEPADDAPGK